MKPSILFFLNGNYPPDIRLDKEISILQKTFDVHILAGNGAGLITKSTYGEEVKTINYAHENFVLRLIGKISFLLSQLDIVFLYKIIYLVKKNNIKIIHSHDLPAIATAAFYKKNINNSVALVADNHENFPYAVQFRIRKGIFYIFDRYRFSFTRWLKLQAYCFDVADRVFVTCSKMSELILKDTPNFDNKKITIIQNSESRNLKEHLKLFSDNNSNFIELTYVGSFGKHRGLESVIEALKITQNKNIRFTIVGPSSVQYRDKISLLGKELIISGNLRIMESIPFVDALSLISTSDIGIIPHERNPHTDNTVPHKLYQYISLNIPVIVSDCPALLDVLNTGAYGHSFQNISELVRILDNAVKRKKIMDELILSHTLLPNSIFFEDTASELQNQYNFLCKKYKNN